MKPAPFLYRRAGSVEHAVTLLAEFAPQGGRLLAGGQSLAPIMAFRLTQPTHLIDINAIGGGMDRLHEDGTALSIPALVRHAAFRPAVVANPLGDLLAAVCRHIAHAPIRARGTFCGSLAHADPASEWCLVFVTLGGTASARSMAGTRQIAASDFLRGIMTTALAADEMLTEIRLPSLTADTRHGFDECSRRTGDYAMAMALATWRLVGGVMRDVRVGVGGVEPVPRRLVEAEAALDGRAPTDAVFAIAADTAAAVVEPMLDGQMTAAFRRGLTRATTRRALVRARG